MNTIQLLSLLSLLIFVTGVASAQSFSGTYAAHTGTDQLVLTLQQDAQQTVQGTFSFGGFSYQVAGRVEQTGLAGTISGSDGMMGFIAQPQGNDLLVQLFGVDASGQPDYSTAQAALFTRQGGTGTPQASNYPPQASNYPSAAPAREAYVNGVRLSGDQLLALEQQYRLQVPAGRFWYDARCGAYGQEGGPTLGFIMPGINIAPMPANISGGGTSIFINGREIHPQDQMVLHQMLGVTYPGRYWLDAQGNLGIEGGGVLVNLAQVAQQRGGQGGVYSGMGGMVGVAGTGEAVVSFKNPSGGYTDWTN